MPNSRFLEKEFLYKKFPLVIPPALNLIEKVSINMYCNECKSNQTFNMINDYHQLAPYANSPSEGQVVIATYLYAACRRQLRKFLLEFDINLKYVRKVGQFPPPDISIDKDLERWLGIHVEFYKKGLINESQGYGIGAYSYYRRIIEEKIDELLDLIKDLMEEKDKLNYEKALEETKKTRITLDKIDLVKHLLPSILRPNGMNPLAVLHSILSSGLHGMTDEKCLELAVQIRKVLVFLLKQLFRSREEKKEFTEEMRKLLEKKK